MVFLSIDFSSICAILLRFVLKFCSTLTVANQHVGPKVRRSYFSRLHEVADAGGHAFLEDLALGATGTGALLEQMLGILHFPD